MARRGRGRKSAQEPATSRARGTARKKKGRVAGKRGRGASAAGAGGEGELLTLVQIGQMTGISYPTLLRYVRLHLDRLPHTGSGRKRRFRPGAVAVFQELRAQSRRGPRSSGRAAAGAAPSVTRQLARLERGQRELARQLKELRKSLSRPVRIRLER